MQRTQQVGKRKKSSAVEVAIFNIQFPEKKNEFNEPRQGGI